MHLPPLPARRETTGRELDGGGRGAGQMVDLPPHPARRETTGRELDGGGRGAGRWWFCQFGAVPGGQWWW
jgi:hypothetical protein